MASHPATIELCVVGYAVDKVCRFTLQSCLDTELYFFVLAGYLQHLWIYSSAATAESESKSAFFKSPR